MTKRNAKQAEASDAANGQYFEQQASRDLSFKSPFAMLNLTAQDCQQQRIEIGMSDADLERDKAIFNRVVDDQIKQHGYPDTNEKVDAFLLLAFEFVTNGMRDKRYPQSHWPLVACHAALVTLQTAQSKKTFKVDSAMTNVALFAQGMMNIAWKPAKVSAIEQLVEASRVTIAAQEQALQIRQKEIDFSRPRLRAYERFEKNQTRTDKRSPIAKAIAAYLQKFPRASADRVFDELAKSAIGKKFYFDRPRYMGYEPEIRLRNGAEKVKMRMARFRNLVSELRPKD